MNNRKKILFIINPISGIGKKGKIPKSIDKHLNKKIYDFDIIYTEYKNHGHKIALDNKSIYNVIVAIGGDGTVSEIGSALINSNCILGIIPCGSGNGIARHLNQPLKLKKAIQLINRNQSIKIDTGNVNGKIFIGTCGFGFDAHIAKKFDEFHKRGFTSYIKLVRKEYNSFREINYTIDKTYQKTAVMCSVANSSQFGNGFTISPFSNIQDGKFEIIFLEKVIFRHVPKLIKQFFSKQIHLSRYFSSITVNNNFLLETTNKKNIEFHLDGEPMSPTNRFEIEIHEKSLSILV